MAKEYYARLFVTDFKSMSKRQRADFVKWLRGIATEMNKEDPKIYAAPFRATLYK